VIVIVLGIVLALLAVASGVQAVCAKRISDRLPESYFEYAGTPERKWWVNGYFFYRRSSRENWVKSTIAWSCASLVLCGVAAAMVLS
jgi:hypothetical protein